jgi:hypothetical protein
LAGDEAAAAEPPCCLFRCGAIRNAARLHTQEDASLTKLIAMYGTKNWSIVAAGIKGRSGKSCRLR